uniref:Uncharacterized protein n=1 Tax=Cacopsylla melanoneura TaxID=428564 RepID=A0A8D8S5S8_9HEMI
MATFSAVRFCSLVVVGERSQDSSRYKKYRNTQCTSNALGSLCMARTLSVSEWTSGTITDILDIGFKIHKRSFENRTDKSSEYLASDELLLDDIKVGSKKIECEAVSEFGLGGYLYYNLVQLVGTFFEKYSYGIFTFNNTSTLANCIF